MIGIELQAPDVPPSRNVAFDMPQPELAEAVKASMVTLNELVARFPEAARDFDTLIQWTAALNQWRNDLYLAQGYLCAAGFDIPSWDIDLSQTPTLFITTWRDYLAKVGPLVDTARAGHFHRVQ